MTSDTMSFIIPQGITAAGTQSIADALHLHTSVTELILAHNPLTDQGELTWPTLLSMFMYCTHLNSWTGSLICVKNRQPDSTYSKRMGACQQAPSLPCTCCTSFHAYHMQRHALFTCQSAAMMYIELLFVRRSATICSRQCVTHISVAHLCGHVKTLQYAQM